MGFTTWESIQNWATLCVCVCVCVCARARALHTHPPLMETLPYVEKHYNEHINKPVSKN